MKRKALDLVAAFPNSAFSPTVSEDHINNISLFDENGNSLDTDESLKLLLKNNNPGRLVIKYSIQYAGSPGTSGGSNALGGGSNPFGGRRRRYRRKTKRRNQKRKSYRRK